MPDDVEIVGYTAFRAHLRQAHGIRNISTNDVNKYRKDGGIHVDRFTRQQQELDRLAQQNRELEQTHRLALQEHELELARRRNAELERAIALLEQGSTVYTRRVVPSSSRGFTVSLATDSVPDPVNPSPEPINQSAIDNVKKAAAELADTVVNTHSVLNVISNIQIQAPTSVQDNEQPSTSGLQQSAVSAQQVEHHTHETTSSSIAEQMDEEGDAILNKAADELESGVYFDLISLPSGVITHW